MGRHGLSKAQIFLGACVLLLTLASLATAAAVGFRRHRHHLLDPAGMARHAQLNISQTEFETRHEEYFEAVERSQRQRLSSDESEGSYKEAIVRRRLFRFPHSGLENSRHSPSAASSRRLRYELHIPKENNSDFEVEEASLRMLIVPRQCANGRTVTLTTEAEGEVLSRGKYPLDGCLPRWVGLDVTRGLPRVNGSFNVEVRCEECSVDSIDFVDPVLNVIARLNHTLRRRRAPKGKTEKVNKRRGPCAKHDLQVDLEQLGSDYNFIVQPRIFEAGYCIGKCKAENLLTQHSMFQLQVSKLNSSVPKPCCSASKMAQLEFLYADENDPTKLKVGQWHNTLVLECGCS